MSRAIGFVLLGVGGWLALGALGGCNSLLDIEEAQQRASGGSAGSLQNPSTGTAPVPRDTSTCDTVGQKCSDCLATNYPASAQQECLDDPECRSNMLAYGNCLGKECKESEQGVCFEPLGASAGIPMAFLDCALPCAASAIFSTCEIYCGCMGSNCLGTFADKADCMTECQQVPDLGTVKCRLTHCEIAPHYKGESALHCQHAIGVGQCQSMASSPPVPSCNNKYLNSFACSDNSQCCSNNCNSLRSCAPP